MFKFEIQYKDTLTNARKGLIHTNHGVVETPAFMPVATQGTVKAMSPEEIESIGFDILVVNAYHMYLRPGHLRVQKQGGLHKFMSWKHTILTDSGGFQALSLSKASKIQEDGILFQSHIDGSKHFITPAKCIEIQDALNSDIMMCLDECPPFSSTFDYISKSVNLTTSWAKSCREASIEVDKALFGIVQGGVYPELRDKSLNDLLEIDFDGYAVGGLGIGESKEQTYEIGERMISSIPFEKPRYLMGLGSPKDIIEAVSNGVDVFDCVVPTRNARNGTLFTNHGKMVIKNARYVDDESPIDEQCGCYTCSTFSRAYLRHLYITREILALRLLTLHNLYYYCHLMKQIRGEVIKDEFYNFKTKFKYSGGIKE